MLGAARALMLSGGYRPSSSEGHAAVVRFMEAVSSDGEMLRFTGILDRLRRKRHRVVYEEYDIPAGEEHWHGATDDTDFEHLYVVPLNSKTTY